MSKKADKKEAATTAKEPSKPAAAVAEEPKKEEVKPQKSTAAAPKAEKKYKKKQKGIYSIYKAEGEKAVRLRPTCERCGPGYFMADHHERFTCGHCGFTRYKRS